MRYRSGDRVVDRETNDHGTVVGVRRDRRFDLGIDAFEMRYRVEWDNSIVRGFEDWVGGGEIRPLEKKGE
jgi:hypothetical protein